MKRLGVLLGAALSLGWLSVTVGRPAAQPAQPQKRTYVGAETCAGCHVDLAKEWQALPHTAYLMSAKRNVENKGCEECHGPGSEHAAGDVKAITNPMKVKPEQEAGICLRCHGDVMKAQEWHGTAHAKAKVRCTQCHDMHTPKAAHMLRAEPPALCFTCHPEQRGQFRQNSHHPVMEGRMACPDCHDVHRSSEDYMLARRGNLCVSCHGDKAGPFLFSHDMATGNSDETCLECHRGHGSPQPQLRRANGRALCMQCHIDKATHNPGRTCWDAPCHTELHGSNRDDTLGATR